MTLKQKIKKGLKSCLKLEGNYDLSLCENCVYKGKCFEPETNIVADTLQVITDLEEKNKKLAKKVKDLKGTVHRRLEPKGWDTRYRSQGE